MEQKNYYQILGVSQEADVRTIKEAYRRLAFEYHPDRNSGDTGALEKMKTINEAYAVLSDSTKRKKYDGMSARYGSYAYDEFHQTYSEDDIYRNSDINQIFEEMARTFGFRGFDEVFRGVYREGAGESYQFHRPGMFGKVIVFGPGGWNRLGNRTEGKTGPGVVARIMTRVIQYAVTRMLRSFGGFPTEVSETIVIDRDQAKRGGRVTFNDSRRAKKISIILPPDTNDGQVIRLKGVEDEVGHTRDMYLRVDVKQPLLKKIRKLLYK